MKSGSKEFFPALEGIRGYAFLAVFIIHYWGRWENPGRDLFNPRFLIANVGWFLVPIFFVLSGFLITRILLSTKDREGYFKVFYFRRAIRVLPLYYVTVLSVGLLALALHWTWNKDYLFFLVYLHNFSFACFNFRNSIHHPLDLGHLWSMAIEEQFYLLWPPAILWLRTEKSVLQFSYFLIAACVVIRLAWPLFSLPYFYSYDNTFTRFDGLVMGAVLAIHYRRQTHWAKLVAWSRWAIPAILIGMTALAIVTGSSSPSNYVGTAFCIPLMNVVGLAFVVLTLEPSSVIHRVCSGVAICRFGRLSYGMYLFHYIYAPYIREDVFAWASRYVPRFLAQPALALGALGLTYGLALVAYRVIEMPAMRLKSKVCYGRMLVTISRIRTAGSSYSRLAVTSASRLAMVVSRF